MVKMLQKEVNGCGTHRPGYVPKMESGGLCLFREQFVSYVLYIR